MERPPPQAFHNQYSRRRRGGSSCTHEERHLSPTFEQGGPYSTFEFGGTSYAAPLPPPLPYHTDLDHVLASLQGLHLRMDDFHQKFERIDVQQSRIDQFMVDYQRSQYPVYDHHYRQGHITSDHVHPSWYTPPPGDFGYVYGSRGR